MDRGETESTEQSKSWDLDLGMEEEGEAAAGGEEYFRRLSDDCIAYILSLTSPADVVRCSAVCPTFRSAAESDAVWVKFLPPEYCSNSSSKKELFFQLCRPTLIEAGAKSFWLERSSGKKCLMLSARDLSIAWGDDQRYWQWVDAPPGSAFSEVAHLSHVWWFHVHGMISSALLSWGTVYAVHFVLIHDVQGHFGWDHSPVELSLHIRRNPNDHKCSVLLSPDSEDSILQPSVQFSGWNEVKMGEFLCDEDGGEIDFGMRELSSYKGGISILGVAFRPVIS